MSFNDIPSVAALKAERQARTAALISLAAAFAATCSSDELAITSGGIFPARIEQFRKDNGIGNNEREFTSELMRLGHIEIKSKPKKLTPDQIVGKLIKLFKESSAAATAADPGAGLENDGGTCNTDTPAFRIDGVRFNIIERAALLSGVRVTEFKWIGGKKWCWLMVPLHGQAERRSKMMEAAQRVLNAFAESNEIPGFRACGYQQAD